LPPPTRRITSSRSSSGSAGLMRSAPRIAGGEAMMPGRREIRTGMESGKRWARVWSEVSRKWRGRDAKVARHARRQSVLAR
jgi:hypothetical protein